MAQRFKELFPPFAATLNEREFVMQLADENMSYPGQVLRQAIEKLRASPDTKALSPKEFDAMLPTMRVTESQKDFVDELAAKLNVSRAQVLRNAIFALQLSIGNK